MYNFIAYKYLTWEISYLDLDLDNDSDPFFLFLFSRFLRMTFRTS